MMAYPRAFYLVLSRTSPVDVGDRSRHLSMRWMASGSSAQMERNGMAFVGPHRRQSHRLQSQMRYFPLGCA